ncbi:glycosyltransferase family 4 protein [Candidatus Peregrinibacteria bacterium]|nr:glycosyltransferase family 4 protein [Candidatus Peregrinibacteria bacterium]
MNVNEHHRATILLISPYWKEEHRWMASSVKLAELWQRLGYRVVVACMSKESGVDRVSDTLTIHRRKDFFLADPWNYGISFGFAGYVRHLVKNVKPDVIVVNKLLFWSSFSTISLRLHGYRVIQLTDAFVGMTWWPRSMLPKIGAAIYAWTAGWIILLCASRVVTFHPQPERLLKHLGIAQKTQVIPTGIDPAPYEVESARLPDGQGRAGKVESKITITYVGRLESVKGVDDYLAAAAPLASNHVTVQVVGWYKEGHPLVATYKDRVRFTGLRHDIPVVLGETDIFVLPSYSEGLSNALMEAMASGCACIASDVGGNRFLIQNGVSGFLFPAGDRAALSAHLKRLIDDSSKRSSMGEAARRRIADQFSWRNVGKQYQELFSSFVA